MGAHSVFASRDPGVICMGLFFFILGISLFLRPIVIVQIDEKKYEILVFFFKTFSFSVNWEDIRTIIASRHTTPIIISIKKERGIQKFRIPFVEKYPELIKEILQRSRNATIDNRTEEILEDKTLQHFYNIWIKIINIVAFLSILGAVMFFIKLLFYNSSVQ